MQSLYEKFKKETPNFEEKEQMAEAELNKEQAEALWNSKVAEAKKHLKQCSKNDLIRTCIGMMVRCYELEVQMQNLTNNEGANNEEPTANFEPSPQS